MATRLYSFYGENKLVEPQAQIVRETWKQIGQSVSNTIQPGVYCDKQYVTGVLHAAYNFVETRLRRLIRRIASHESMEFVLYQYDLAAELWHAVPDSDAHRESGLASRRRALKHLSEQFAMRSPPECSPINYRNLIPEVEEAILCAEILVILAASSDQAYFLFPNHIQLTVFSGGDFLPFRLEPLAPFDTAAVEFNRRLSKDRKFRPKCLPNPTADRDVVFQAKFLDKSFTKEFGLRYDEFLNAIVCILRDIAPASGSYPIVFCHKDGIVQALASAAKMSSATAKRIVDGFTLRSSDMKDEGRQLWNVKQTFRAYRRGFFELPHPTGRHLIWSKKMADESLNWLVEGFSFRKLPLEWSNSETMSGLDQLSHAGGLWFEQQTARVLAELRIVGSRRKGRIQGNDQLIEIPPAVGEIDFLGACREDESVIVVECKMVESRMEARFWKEDIAEFVEGKRSYAEKFRMKVKWVLENKSQIGKALMGTESLREVRTIMITLYPTFASIRINDFPCVSLAEFFADHEGVGGWPYKMGVYTGN